MNLKVLTGITDLASPAIAAQDLFSELVVSFRIELQAGSPGPNRIHEGFAFTCPAPAE
jgi:hypothetical protein